MIQVEGDHGRRPSIECASSADVCVRNFVAGAVLPLGSFGWTEKERIAKLAVVLLYTRDLETSREYGIVCKSTERQVQVGSLRS